MNTSFVYKSLSDTQVTRKVSDTSNLAMESVKKYLLQCVCPHILHIISSTASTCIEECKGQKLVLLKSDDTRLECFEERFKCPSGVFWHSQVITPSHHPLHHKDSILKVTQALPSITLLNFWVAVELIRCPLKPTPSGVCKFAETLGSTVQWSQRYVLIMNPPPSRSPYEWSSSWPCLLLTWTRLHSCGHSSAIRPNVICASINQSVPLFSFMCLKIYSSVWNICCSWRGLNVKCHLKYCLTWWQQLKWKLWYQIQIYLINLKEMGICRLWKCSFPLRVYLIISQNCIFLQSPLTGYRITECKCSLACLASAQSNVPTLWWDFSSSSSVMPWSTKHKKLTYCHHHRKSDRIQWGDSTKWDIVIRGVWQWKLETQCTSTNTDHLSVSCPSCL
jgi:hypothetical protein